MRMSRSWAIALSGAALATVAAVAVVPAMAQRATGGRDSPAAGSVAGDAAAPAPVPTAGWHAPAGKTMSTSSTETLSAITGGSRWISAVPPGGTASIRSVPTGRCVDSNDHAEFWTGGEAYSLDCNFSRRQYWSEAPSLRLEGETLRPFANEYRLVNRQTGLCLDSNKVGMVYALPCLKADAFQSWIRVTPALKNPPADEAQWPVVYLDIATSRCLSIRADQVLRTVVCGKNLPGQNWTDDMFFLRGNYRQ
jgi:hypothetical protein